jgi:hypothetical protein
MVFRGHIGGLLGRFGSDWFLTGHTITILFYGPPIAYNGLGQLVLPDSEAHRSNRMNPPMVEVAGFSVSSSLFIFGSAMAGLHGGRGGRVVRWK